MPTVHPIEDGLLPEPYTDYLYVQRGEKRVHLSDDSLEPPLCGVWLNPQVFAFIATGRPINLCPKCARIARARASTTEEKP